MNYTNTYIYIYINSLIILDFPFRFHDALHFNMNVIRLKVSYFFPTEHVIYDGVYQGEDDYKIEPHYAHQVQ